MKRLLLAMTAVLGLALPAQAQFSNCKAFPLPDQGVGLLQTALTVPPGAEGIYPVQFRFPAGARSVSIVKWTHAVQPGLPVGSVQLREYINNNPIPEGLIHNAFLTGIFFNDAVGTPTTFAESTPLLPNQDYIVWVGNFNDFPITVHLAVHVMVCS